jgi:hypothetical protein
MLFNDLHNAGQGIFVNILNLSDRSRSLRFWFAFDLGDLLFLLLCTNNFCGPFFGAGACLVGILRFLPLKNVKIENRFYLAFAELEALNIQSNSAITNCMGPAKCVRNNRGSL